MFEDLSLSDVYDEETGKIRITPREIYNDLLDKENSKFINDHTYRVHFKDGMDIDICEENISILDTEDGEFLEILQEGAIGRRGMEDMLNAIIKATINEIKEGK